MFVHTMLLAAAEGEHEAPYKNHEPYFVGVTVMLIFILLLMIALAFNKDR